jgi:hypothetical protein
VLPAQHVGQPHLGVPAVEPAPGGEVPVLSGSGPSTNWAKARSFISSTKTKP